MESTATKADVIIIGAGIAGISCARRLIKYGLSCIIVEGRNRIGGRISTENLGKQAIDTGACYLHGSSQKNPIFRKYKKYNLKQKEHNGYENTMYFKGGKKADRVLKESEQSYVRKSCNQIMQNVEYLQTAIQSKDHELYQQKDELTVSQGIEFIMKSMKIEFPKDSYSEHLFNYHLWVHEEYEGIQFTKQSLLSYQQEEFFSGGNSSFDDGYISLVNILAKGLDIRLGNIVTDVIQEENQCIVKTSNAKSFIGDFAVVTVPIGVLKAGKIKFTPQLPESKIKAINKLDMGLMNKVALHFPKMFWDDNIYRIEYISNIKGEFPWIENYSSKEPILYCWLACEYAEKLEKLNDKETIQQVMTILKSLYGQNIPDPVSYLISRWKSDEFSYGSWSVRPVGAGLSDNNELRVPFDKLYLCGEAASDYIGTVAGAYISGKEQAYKILEVRFNGMVPEKPQKSKDNLKDKFGKQNTSF